jgi:hypothetical protein
MYYTIGFHIFSCIVKEIRVKGVLLLKLNPEENAFQSAFCAGSVIFGTDVAL